MILSQLLHSFKDGDTFVAAQVEGQNLVIASTRNDEHAAEGQYTNLVTVIALADAIAIAKAVLAMQDVEDAAFEAHIEAQWQRRQDYLMLLDDAIEDDYAWISHGC